MPQLPEKVSTDYKIRLERVFQFIDANLHNSPSLKEVAEIAYFSPYHFHRIFKLLTGETLKTFINRRKIENSVIDLMHTSQSITHIAHHYGFNDNAAYSKAFKKFYGNSPSQFKKQHPNKYDKIRILKSKNGQVYPEFASYILTINKLQRWLETKANVKVMHIEQQHLASITVLGTHQLSAAFSRLINWATTHGLMHSESKLLTRYYGSLKVTPEEKIRMHAAIVVERPIKAAGEIAPAILQGCKVVVGKFKIKPEEFEQAWTALFLWMDSHGYAPAKTAPFEIYHNDFKSEKWAIVDMHIPII